MGVDLISHIVFVLGLQELDSFIHRHISFLFRGLSRIDSVSVFSRLPCAIQWVLLDYLPGNSVYMLILTS